MIIPSAIKVKEEDVQIEDKGDGLYVFSNAYEGPIEYFPGRPFGTVDSKGKIDLDESVIEFLDAAELVSEPRANE